MSYYLDPISIFIIFIVFVLLLYHFNLSSRNQYELIFLQAKDLTSEQKGIIRINGRDSQGKIVRRETRKVRNLDDCQTVKVATT